MVDKMPVEIGLVLFLVFIAISLIVAARAAVKSKKKKSVPKKRYKPYQPQAQHFGGSSPSQQVYTYSAKQNANSKEIPESRAAYASADEYFRAGMYDRAKEEYLKTGRVFGAAKSIAAKGREFVPDSIEIISRYAPEREEEMVRNLSRYFYDSGETEISAYILFEKGLEEEADAVLATIGKSVSDITPSGVVEVSTIDQPIVIQEVDDQRSLEELEEIAAEVKEEEKEIEVEAKPFPKSKLPATQPMKVATSDLDERCSVCMSPIKAGESFIRCPFCEIPSHYAHIVEWIKVKPQCPNCRKKLVSRMFQA